MEDQPLASTHKDTHTHIHTHTHTLYIKSRYHGTYLEAGRKSNQPNYFEFVYIFLLLFRKSHYVSQDETQYSNSQYSASWVLGLPRKYAQLHQVQINFSWE